MADEINFEVTGFGQLRQQLKEAQLEMLKLQEAGKQGSAEFLAAAQRAGKIKDAIDDSRDALNAFTGAGKIQAFTKSLAAVSGGFTAVQGAIGLVSDDTKAFEETFKKLQSAMALTQGLTALEDMGRAFGTLKVVAVNAFNAIKVAIGTTGIGLLVVALGAVVTYWEEIAAAIGIAEKEQKKYLVTQEEIVAQSGKEVSTIEGLIRTIKNQNLSYKARQEALEDLKKIMPGITQLDLNQKDAIDKLSSAQTAYIKVLKARANVELQNAAYVEAQKAVLARQAKGLDVGSSADVLTFLKAVFTMQDAADLRLKESGARYGKEIGQLYEQVALIEQARDKAFEEAAVAESEYNRLVGLGAGGAAPKTDPEAARKAAQQKKIQALEAQKELDLALLEQEKLTTLAKAETEEERARIEQIYLEKSLNRRAKFEIDREDLRDKEEKNAKSLQAKLQDLDNQSVKSAKDTEGKIKDIKDKKAKEAEDSRKQKEEERKASAKKEFEDRKAEIDKIYKAREVAIRKEEISEEEKQAKLDQLELDRLAKHKINAEDYVATVEGADAEVVDIALQTQKKLEEIEKKKREDDKKTQEDKLKNFKEYADLAINLAQGVTDAFAAKNDAEKQMELERVKESKQSEEEKAKAIDDINRKYFEKDKQVQIANSIISTLAGALNAFMSTLKVDPTGITGSILAAAALAAGYFQIEKIRATTYQSNLPAGSTEGAKPTGSRYAEGGVLLGPGHDMGGIRTSFGELEGGEFVINRRATANFLPLLEMINAQGNLGGPEMPRSAYQPVIKTYVLATEVTSAQEANAKIAGLARLT